jgi:hypothetical protein
MPRVVRPPAYLTKSTPAKIGQAGFDREFVPRHTRYVDELPSVRQVVLKEFSLEYAVTKAHWSLASVDAGVRVNLIEVFKRAGKTYIRIL